MPDAASTAAVDANVLLRILLGDPPGQAEAGYRLLEESAAEGRPLRVYPWTVAEMVFVLERGYRVARLDVAGDLSAFLDHPGLEVQSPDMVFAALALYAAHNVSFGDALLAASMRADGCQTIWSWDRDFDRLPYVSRRRPSDRDGSGLP